MDQCPKATGVPAVRRPGTSNQGMKPSGAPPTPSFVANSIVPSALQKRRRVRLLTTQRQRATPVRPSSHWAGSLPYICVRNSPSDGLRNIASTSPAKATV